MAPRRLAVLLAAAAACCAVAAAAAPADAAAAASVSNRRLKQVSVFYETPAAAGSTSVDLNANLGLRPDGTVHASGGGAATTTTALSNPLLNILTRGGYKNRPRAASTAYTQIPLAQQFSVFPTLSYGLAESKGDLASASNGGWLNGEFGYNPINNNLGASASAGTSGTANLGASERVGQVNPDAGLSGVEFSGYANDLTNAADSRTDQSAQAIAYPYNILSPLNPLTCTQALLAASTITQYDLGAPVTPPVRRTPAAILPLCLNLFNFATLDDFSDFVGDEGRQASNDGSAIEDPSQFFDQGDGRIPAVEANAALAARLLNATGSTRVFNTQPRSNGTTFTQAAASEGNVTVAPPGQQLGALEAAEQPAGDYEDDRSSNRRSATAGGREPGAPRAGSARAQALTSFRGALGSAVERGPAAVSALFSTGVGQALLDRVGSGPLGQAVDGGTSLAAQTAAKLAERFGGPLASLNRAAGDLGAAAASGAGQVGMRAAVAAIETAEPVLAARAAVGKALSPLAAASKGAAARAAARAASEVRDVIAALPEEGTDKAQLVTAFNKLNTPAASTDGDAAASAAQQPAAAPQEPDAAAAMGRK